jgi:hypothetical protein
MEVDAPVPPPAADAPAAAVAPPPPPSSVSLTEHLANALSQHDYALALRVANDLEIVIQVELGTDRKRKGGLGCWGGKACGFGKSWHAHPRLLPPSLPPSHASYTQTNQFDPAYGNPQLLLAVQLLLLLILNDLYVVVIVCFACLPFFLGPSLSLPPFHLPPPISLP